MWHSQNLKDGGGPLRDAHPFKALILFLRLELGSLHTYQEAHHSTGGSNNLFWPPAFPPFTPCMHIYRYKYIHINLNAKMEIVNFI